MLISRARKLRFRRKLKMQKAQVTSAGEQVDTYVIRRFGRLSPVRRFVFAWMVLIALLAGCSIAQLHSLSNYYQTLQPASGGTYNEGVLGSFSNANPLYATSAADRTVSQLVFSGLLQYDNHNKLVGNLADSWKVDDRGQVYTVHLRENAQWHDGQLVTADDVAYTFKTIQNPDAASPLNVSWQGVDIKVTDPRTVVFTLPNALASFADSLTTGIIPKHVLKDTKAADMRSSIFNTARPIGSGPFRWQDVTPTGIGDNRQDLIHLNAFSHYYGGKPKLDSYIVHVFRDERHMINSYKNHELQAMVGLQTVPRDIKESDRHMYSFPQTAAVMAFFKTSNPVLSDKAVRQALVQATDTRAIRNELPYPAREVNEPILRNQTGYDVTLKQLAYNQSAAAKQLADAGWANQRSSDVRQKGTQKLNVRVIAENNQENAHIARQLQQQWRAIGVRAEVELLNPSALQITLAGHDYDVLVKGISIGADPDVFVYWHSSQASVLANSRLNFSEYKSSVADEALELGRTRMDPALRAVKYKTFLSAWRDDAPAVGLYQPRLLYITRQPVNGLSEHQVNSASDRLYNVHNWTIRQVKADMQ